MHGGWGGSGTVVCVENGRALVITNRHVVEKGDGNATIRFPSGRVAEGQLLASGQQVATDKFGVDLAAIMIPADAQTPCVPIAQGSVSQGDKICQIGYGGGQFQRRTGAVVGYRHTQPYNLVVSFQVISGDSGSGVFSLKEKALAGVIWGGIAWNGSTWETQAVAHNQVARFYYACLPIFRQRPIFGPRQPRPPSGGGIPPMTPNEPGTPIQPPAQPPAVQPPAQQPPAADPFAELAKLRKDLEEKLAAMESRHGESTMTLAGKAAALAKDLAALQAQHGTGLKTTEDKIKAATDAIARLRALTDSEHRQLQGDLGVVADTAAKIPGLESKIGEVTGKLGDVGSKVGDLLTKAPELAGKIAAVAETVAAVDAKVAPLLSAVPGWGTLAGIGLGGAGLLSGGLALALRKKSKSSPTPSPDYTPGLSGLLDLLRQRNQQPATVPGSGGPSQQAPAAPSTPAPLPEMTRFVGYDKPDPWAAALQESAEIYKRENPSSTAADMILARAEKILGGKLAGAKGKQS